MSQTKDQITDQKLRDLGFIYHTINKYYYNYRSVSTLLVFPPKNDEYWVIKTVNPSVAPENYDSQAADLCYDGSMDDLISLIEMGEK